jgi:predicted RNA-binding protein
MNRSRSRDRSGSKFAAISNALSQPTKVELKNFKQDPLKNEKLFEAVNAKNYKKDYEMYAL